MKPLLLSLLALTLPLHAAPVWLQWTGTGGASGLTGSFPSGGPGGTVIATRTSATDGAGNGVTGPTAQSLGGLSPTFTTHYGNGNAGSLPFIGNTYNDSGDRYTVTLDFTSLVGGALAAGSLFAFVDYDISESLQDLNALTFGGAAVNSAWLTPIAGQPGYLDAVGSGAGDESTSMSVAAPTLTQAGGVYQVSGAVGNMDSGLNVFRTNVALTSISYVHFRNVPGNAVGGGGGGLAIGSEVPEPTTWALGAAGLALLAWRRKSALANN